MVLLDDSVRFVGFTAYVDTMPPTLYKSDSYTVLREVTDLRTLRAGDRCVVGLNVLHKLTRWTDQLCSLLTSWEVLPIALYHHFILLDDVATLEFVGGRGKVVPLRADGKQVRIAEFSDSFMGAWRRFVADGYWPLRLLRNAAKVLASPAKLHTPPLSDYLELNGRGVFCVQESRTEAQRRKTVEAARALAEEQAAQPTYNPIFCNCEHMTNSLMVAADGADPRWVSPQVPHVLWILFRISLQLVGLGCLYVCAVAPAESHRAHAVAATLFHLFSTIPIGAQVQIVAFRTCVNLTQRRALGEIDQEAFDYLMTKEGSRTVLVLIVAVGGVCQLPRLVWDFPSRFRLACALSMLALNLANIVFNCVQQALVRLLLATGVGVPVPRFDDYRLGNITHTATAKKKQQVEPEAAPASRAAGPAPRPLSSPARRRGGGGRSAAARASERA